MVHTWKIPGTNTKKRPRTNSIDMSSGAVKKRKPMVQMTIHELSSLYGYMDGSTDSSYQMSDVHSSDEEVKTTIRKKPRGETINAAKASKQRWQEAGRQAKKALKQRQRVAVGKQKAKRREATKAVNKIAAARARKQPEAIMHKKRAAAEGIKCLQCILRNEDCSPTRGAKGACESCRKSKRRCTFPNSPRFPRELLPKSIDHHRVVDRICRAAYFMRLDDDMVETTFLQGADFSSAERCKTLCYVKKYY